MMRVLDVGPTEGLKQFRALLEAEDVGDVDVIARTAEVLIVFYGSNETVRSALRGELKELLALERRWYASLAAGQPDFDVYSEVPYLSDTWACWMTYSRRYLREVETPTRYPPLGISGAVGTPQTVLDLGCGFGYSTLALKQMFPDARVVGTNVAGTPQTRIANRLGAEHGFEVVDSPNVLDEADLVFASEYFEHWQRPVDHLHDVLALKPSALLVANTFGPHSIGHFDAYEVGGATVDPKRAARCFASALVDAGYEKVKTGVWNNRPTYWRKGVDPATLAP